MFTLHVKYLHSTARYDMQVQVYCSVVDSCPPFQATRVAYCYMRECWCRTAALLVPECSFHHIFFFVTLICSVSERKKLGQTCNRSRRPIGLWDVEASIFSRQSAHRWRWGCLPYAQAAFYPQEDSWYSFLLAAESTPGPYCGWKD
jgi:hypothetical protein